VTVPTIADRIAQEVARRYLEPILEPVFHTDSYGSAIDAVGKARERCWRYDWVLDLDIKGFFDSIDWEMMLKAVRHHTDCPWVLLYVERWLKASVKMEDGSIVTRTAGTPQGGVISPLLANLFLHYAFDMWMVREFPHIPFERYADDAICHCRSAEEARALWSALGDRLAACKLVLHPVKTKVVYCKDVRRRGDFPVISFDFLGFQFRARKTMWRKGEKRIFTHRFQPAASPKALTRISREIRGWALHRRSDKSLTELAKITIRAFAAGSPTTAISARCNCVPLSSGSMPMSSDGHAASSSGCAIRPRAQEIGSTGSAGRIRSFSPTGRYAMATAEQ
jgi:RNA-directed DNA polymerase